MCPMGFSRGHWAAGSVPSWPAGPHRSPSVCRYVPVMLSFLSFCNRVVINVSVAAGMQATIAWRKSSFSLNGGACVEVGSEAGSVVVRDSVAPASLTLRWSGQAWRAFATALRARPAEPR
jgi:hypothetical protein